MTAATADEGEDLEEEAPKRSRPWLWPLIGVSMLFLATFGAVGWLWHAGVFNRNSSGKTVASTSAATPSKSKAGNDREDALAKLELRKAELDGPDAAKQEKALRGLANSLTHSDVQVRRRAAEILGETGFDTDPVLGELKTALKDTDPQVQLSIAKAMDKRDERLAERNAKAREATLAALDDRIRETANSKPEIQAKAMKEIAANLSNPALDLRRKAAAFFAETDLDLEGVMGPIRAAAKDGDSNVEKSAGRAVENYDKLTAKKREKNREAALTQLKDHLADAKSSNATTRRKGLSGLLVALRSADDAAVRRKAAEGLVELTSDDDSVVEELRAAIKDSDAEVRRLAIQATEAYEIRAGKAVEAHVKKLKSSKASDQIAALQDLAKLGTRARPASAAVAQVLVASGDQSDLKDAALSCFEKIDPKCHPHVVIALYDAGAAKKATAVEKLAALGNEALGAVPVLKTIYVESTKPKFKIVNPNFPCLRALVKIVPGDPDIATEILNFVKSPVEPNRRGGGLRGVGLDCLDKIEVENSRKVDALIPALKDPLYRVAVIKRLGEFRKDAKSALPEITKYKTDSNADVREAAGKAVESIQAD